MLKILTFALSILISLSCWAGSFEIPEESLFIKKTVGKLAAVSFESGDFFAKIDGIRHQINRHDVSGFSKDLTEQKLRIFLNHGYLSLEKIGDNFRVDGKLRLLGGTPPEPEKKGDGKTGGSGVVGHIAGGGCAAVCGSTAFLAAPLCYELCKAAMDAIFDAKNK